MLFERAGGEEYNWKGREKGVREMRRERGVEEIKGSEGE